MRRRIRLGTAGENGLGHSRMGQPVRTLVPHHCRDRLDRHFVFFIYLDAHLTAALGGNKYSAGKIWLIHSGGYYEVEKLKYVPPDKIPELHWYKWEAYLTGLSGITLLFIVYYFGGSGFMVDPAVASLTQPEAVAIGIV